jgi:AcrR family transcriptional regulator
MSEFPKAKQRNGRRKGRPTAKRSVGRDALIAAAREVLKHRPPGEITLNELSQVAGVDPALVRYYFGQLPALFTEAATEITRDLRGRLAAAASQKGSVRDRLHRRIRAYMEVFQANPNYNKLMIEAVNLADNPNRQSILGLVSHSIEEMRDLALEGVRTGDIKSLDGRLLQLAIVAMCEFFFSAHPVFEAIFGREAKDPKFADAYSRFVVSLITCPEADGAKRRARTKHGSNQKHAATGRR